MSTRLTNKEFKRRGRIIHGKKYIDRYVKYVDSDTKVDVKCRKHGIFKIMPCHYINGHGCAKCAGNKISNNEEFEQKSKLKHGNRYDYTKVDYTGNNKKIKITCYKHGTFEMTPHAHLGGQGCPKCGIESRIKLQSKTNKQFKLEVIKKWGNVHGYDYINYKNNTTKVNIECFKHGIFEITPKNYLNGHSCPKCISRISKPEIEFLDYLKIPDTKENRQKYIKPYKIDGYDDKTNTIYEFLGDYWHGNPKKFNGKNIHPKRKISYNKLREKTFKKLQKLKSLGYNVKYIWQNDWKEFKKGTEKIPNIISV
jgi:hypothetical protein